MVTGGHDEEVTAPRSTSASESRGGHSRRQTALQQLQRLAEAIRQGDDEAVERVVLQVSQQRRWLAPLALCVGAFGMLFQGLKLVVFNWRLSLIQVLPAMWIWLAMLDLKVHVLRSKGFKPLHGTGLTLAITGVIVLTAASFFLNAAFAFAIATKGNPDIKGGFGGAWHFRRAVLGAGVVVGAALAWSALLSSRRGLNWFGISMCVVVGVMMVTYVGLPARLLGVKAGGSWWDKATASTIAATIGVVVCSPAYLLDRMGVLLLGSRTFFALGVVLLALGLTLQAGLTSAVKAVKMSAKLVVGIEPTMAVEEASSR